MTGLILAEGPLRDVEVACLLSPTNPMYPEAYSAVAVVNAIAAFLSNISKKHLPVPLTFIQKSIPASWNKRPECCNKV